MMRFWGLGSCFGGVGVFGIGRNKCEEEMNKRKGRGGHAIEVARLYGGVYLGFGLGWREKQTKFINPIH